MGIGMSSFYEEPSISGVESEPELRRYPDRSPVGRSPGTNSGTYPRRVKIPVFRGAFEEDADTHLAQVI